MNKKNVLSSSTWTFFVSRRFARIDRKGKVGATSFLSAVGICFGVMALIAVLSVMNGFQQYSINPIMEISSYHLRVEKLPEEMAFDFADYCDSQKNILCVVPLKESQALIAGSNGKNSAGIIRGVDENINLTDKGFNRELFMLAGSFDLSKENSIVLGEGLARNIGAGPGSTVNLVALSGGKDVDLISQNRIFTVTGIFETTYYDINAGYGFIGLKDADRYFGSETDTVYGIKLTNYEKDIGAVAQFMERFPGLKIRSWREFNRSFFGALRIEKNILMFLVCIIFVVVGVNIYNGMRRLVFERRQEISVFSALGATKQEVKSIFVLRGLTCGLGGGISGLILGLLISFNIRGIFVFLGMITKNSMFDMFAQIPACVKVHEVIFITLFGLLAPLVATSLAARNILDLSVAEVLHDE